MRTFVRRRNLWSPCWKWILRMVNPWPSMSGSCAMRESDQTRKCRSKEECQYLSRPRWRLANTTKIHSAEVPHLIEIDRCNLKGPGIIQWLLEKAGISIEKHCIFDGAGARRFQYPSNTATLSYGYLRSSLISVAYLQKSLEIVVGKYEKYPQRWPVLSYEMFEYKRMKLTSAGRRIVWVIKKMPWI